MIRLLIIKSNALYELAGPQTGSIQTDVITSAFRLASLVIDEFRQR